MSEQVAIRFRCADGEERTHIAVIDWPPHVLRGALYEWVPATTEATR